MHPRELETSQAALTPADIEHLIRTYLTGWCTPGGNAGRMTTFVTDDFVYEDIGANIVIHGKNEFYELVRVSLEAFALNQICKTIIIAPTLDKAAIEATTAGTHKGLFPSMGSFPNIPATYRQFSLTTAAFFEFRGDKISRHVEFYNQYTLFQQIGLLPTKDGKR